MATCPRCYGPLNAHHKCRPRWVRRLLREVLITLLAAGIGALFSIAFWPHLVPVLGMVIAGTIGWGFAAITKQD